MAKILCFLILIPTVGAFFPAPLTNLSQNVTWYTILEQVYSLTGYYYQWHLINSQVYSNLYIAVLQYRNCSGPMFSTNRSIGYGSCSSRPYLQVNGTDMCISTGLYDNGTGFTYPVCQAAVNTTLVTNTVPAQLPDLLPNLTNTLSCADYALPSSHSLCNFYSNWLGFNQTLCMNFVSSHMGLCYVYYDPGSNYGYSQGFYSVEGYQQLNDYILWAVANNYSTSTGVQYRLFESATQAFLALPVLLSDNVTSYYVCYCFCISNMCNTNMSTCLAGLPFNCTYSPIVGTTTGLITSTTITNTTTWTNGTTSTTTTSFSNITMSSVSNSSSMTTTGSTSSSSTSNVTPVSSTMSAPSVSNNLTVVSTLGTTGTWSTGNSSAATVAAEQTAAASPDATTIGLAVGIGLCVLLLLVIAGGLIVSALLRRRKKKSSSTNKVEPDKTESEVTHEQTTPNQEVSTPRQSTPPLQSLQPPRQPIRTNRAFDLRTAAQLYNP